MLRVLGPISIDGPDGHHQSLSRVQRQLVAALVAAGPSGISLDALANELWSSSLPTTWSASLRNHLTRLRTALGGSAELPTRGGVCRLDLPTHLVDAWLLISPRASSEWTDDLVWLLEPSMPYEDVEPTDRITQSTNRILAARRRILDALVVEGGEPLTVAMRDVMRSSAQADPFDEHLTTLSATADAGAGEIARALATVEHNSAIIRHELGDAACRSLDELTDALSSSCRPPTVRTAPNVDTERRFPGQLASAAGASRFARVRQVADAVSWVQASSGVRHLSVEGDWATGKSRFVARVAQALFDDGATVRFATGNPSSLAYEGALTALPELRPILHSLSEQLDSEQPTDAHGDALPGPPQIEQTVLWSRAADTVEQLANDRPLVVVLDDCEQLDSPSLHLFSFLLRSQLSGSLAVVTASSPGVDLALSTNGATRRTTVALDPLDATTIARAVEQTFPDAPAAMTGPLTEATIRLSGGLPSLVRAVLDATDPVTLEPPAELRSPADVVTSLVRGLDADELLAGAAVTVLGLGLTKNASLADIAQILDRPIDDVLVSLDHLIERGLLLDGPRPDVFRARHSPAVKALRAACSRCQLRSLHLGAVALAKTSHGRAHHLYESMPSSDITEVVPALEASARDFFARGAVREALREFERADELAEGKLGPTSRGQMAACLSRLGRLAEADSQRSTAFDLAAADGAWDAALGVMLTGRHDDVVISDQEDRLTRLESIPADSLSPRPRAQASMLMSILAADLGDPERAAVHLGEAKQHVDVRDRHELARVEHLVGSFAHPDDQIRRIRAALDASNAPLNDHQRLVASQLLTIEQYRLGNLDRALEELERFEGLAMALDSVRSRWHCLLVRSMLALSAEDRDTAERLSADAHRFGRRFALVGADQARLAQQFFVRWLDGTHGELLPQLLQLPQSVMTGPARASIATAFLAADRVDEAIAHARPLTESVVSWRATAGPTAAAALAEVAAAANDQGDPTLARHITEALEPLSGTITILGVGVTNRGPIDASLALLEPRGSIRRAELLDRAGDLAQQSGSVLWQKRIVDLH